MEAAVEPEDWATPRCTFLVPDQIVDGPGIDTYCNKPAVGRTMVDKLSGKFPAPRCAEHFPIRGPISGSTLNDLSGEEL